MGKPKQWEKGKIGKTGKNRNWETAGNVNGKSAGNNGKLENSR
jgi:hypothetical protein